MNSSSFSPTDFNADIPNIPNIHYYNKSAPDANKNSDNKFINNINSKCIVTTDNTIGGDKYVNAA